MVITVNIRRGNKHTRKVYQDQTYPCCWPIEVNRNEEGDHQIKVLEFFLINKRKIKSGLCEKKYEKVPCHQLRGAFKSKTNKAEKSAF